MVRWITPIVVVILIVLGLLSGSTLGIAVFTAAAVVAAVRWLWVVMIGPRPLAFEVDLAADEMRVRTLTKIVLVPTRQVRTLLPTGLRSRPKGPRALATDAGTFTVFPEAPGFEGLVAGLRATVPGFEVVTREPDMMSTGSTSVTPTSSTLAADTAGSLASRGASPSANDDSGLVPGVVVVRVYGSQMLADHAVRTLADADITALTLPAEGDLGGIRLAVKDEDRKRAEEVLGH